ncbi:hypothetical protein D3C72_1971410 [compost metagenome]
MTNVSGATGGPGFDPGCNALVGRGNDLVSHVLVDIAHGNFLERKTEERLVARRGGFPGG